VGRLVDRMRLAFAQSTSTEFDWGLPAPLDDHPLSEICRGSVLALTIQAEYLSKGSSFPGNYSHPVELTGVWNTACSYLLGEAADAYHFLKAFFRPESSHRELELGLHALLGNPSAPAARAFLLYDLLKKLPFDLAYHALSLVNRFDSAVSSAVSRKLLSDRVWEDQPSSTPSSALIASDQQALLGRVAGDPLETVQSLQLALKSAGELEDDLIKRFFWTLDELGETDDGWEERAGGVERVLASADFLRTRRTFEASGLIKTGRLDEAGGLLKDDSSDVDFQITLAELRGHTGESVEQVQGLVRSAFQKTLSQIEKHPEISIKRLMRLAEVYLVLNLPAEAARAANTAIELRMDEPRLYQVLNLAYRKAGQLELAESAIRIAMVLAPEGPVDLRRALAETLEFRGEWENALEERVAILESEDLPRLEDLRDLSACALKAGEFKMAIDIAEEALLLDPEDSKTNSVLGEALFYSGSKEDGIQKLQHTVQINPQIPEPWITLAAAQKSLGDFSRSMDTLRSATHAAPDSAEIVIALGRLYLEDSSPTQAAASFRKAVELAPADPLAYSLLGETLLGLGRVDEAEKNLAKAFEISPFDLGIAHSFAKVKLASGKPAEALQSLAIILQSDPPSAEPYFDYGRALLESGQSPAEAVNAFERVLEIDPAHSEARGRLADSLLANGQARQAVEIYSQLLESASGNNSHLEASWLGGAGRAAYELGDFEKAIVLCREAIDLQPENRLLHKNLSEAYLSADLQEDSLESARNALSLGADDLDTLKWFANLAIGQGSETEALSALKRAVELAPHQLGLRLLLGQTQLKAGEESEAWNTFSSITATEAVTTEDLKQAADGFLQLGDARSAIDSLHIAVEKSIGSAEIYMILSRVQTGIEDYTSALDSVEKAALNGYDRPDLPMQKARILQLLNRPQAALACMQQAIHLDPENPALLGWASEMLRDTGDLQESLTFAEKRLRLDPKSLNARFQAADLARGLLETEYAFRILKNGWPESGDARTAEPMAKPSAGGGSLDYYCLYADLCLERDDEISAAEALMAASKQDPSHPRVLALQARIRSRQGSTAEARAMFREFAGPFLDPQTTPRSNPQLLTSLAEAGLELEDWDTTEILVDRAISRRPREIWPALLGARNLVLCAEAQALAESLEIVTHAPGGHALSGERYAKIEQFLRVCQTSLKSTERAQPLKEWEQRADAVFHGEIKGLTELEREFGRDENAIALIVDARRAGWIEHSIKTARTHLQRPLVRGLLALSLADEDLDEDAIREADEAIRQSPDDPRIHFAAAKTLWHAGEELEAVSSIEKALEIWPDEPAWHALAAEWLAHESGPAVDGTHERAAAHLEQAVLLDPGNPAYLVRSGEIQLAVGAVDDAIYRFQEACQLIPRDPLPWTRLAAAQLAQAQYEAAEKSALIAM
ncbi:MAG TPA: tetratricopeptide repeat protein, partial [Anaerolineales bacterium]|nr:tetratricopeptide repeat protein [Anaerolineales bacterium]